MSSSLERYPQPWRDIHILSPTTWNRSATKGAAPQSTSIPDGTKDEPFAATSVPPISIAGRRRKSPSFFRQRRNLSRLTPSAGGNEGPLGI